MDVYLARALVGLALVCGLILWYRKRKQSTIPLFIASMLVWGMISDAIIMITSPELKKLSLDACKSPTTYYTLVCAAVVAVVFILAVNALQSFRFPYRAVVGYLAWFIAVISAIHFAPGFALGALSIALLTLFMLPLCVALLTERKWGRMRN